MKNGPTGRSEFLDLLGALREGTLADEQFARLECCLADDSAAQQLYVEYMVLSAELHRYHGMREACEPSEPGAELWSDLWSLAEPMAPGERPTVLGELVERDQITAARRAAEEVQRQAEAHREAIRKAADDAFARFQEQERLRREELAYRQYLARRRRMAVSVLAVAVLLTSAILVWVSRRPARTASAPAPVAAAPVIPPVVARITRSSNAQWAQEDLSTARGTALRASSMFLRQGLVEMAFEAGSLVLLQAPALVRLESDEQIFLRSGAVSVAIGEDSAGFIVRTPTGTVVDYGTEFGVLVSDRGETEALVYKGKIGVRSGSDPVRAVASTILVEGQAGAVDTAGNVLARPYQPAQIVREMPESPVFGIPGRRLDLADVVGGGNGFGTGKPTSAISPVSGRYVTPIESDRHGAHHYVSIPWSRYIDGAFVPNGAEPQIVSSAGHRFDECPATNNIYYMDVTNVGDSNIGKQVLGGRTYGSPDQPCILMHANLGITFDLAAIASLNAASRIDRFRAVFGVSESGTERPCNADFWVLVDGQVRLSRTGVRTKGIAGEVDVELAETDRFLTLITTDGGDVDGVLRGTDSDWCLFAEPYLELIPRESGMHGP